jgi:urease accessory protein
MIILSRKLEHPTETDTTVPLTLDQRVRSRLRVVLDDMVRGLGLNVTVEDAPFEPEPGAYGGSPHTHGHGHRSH